jgi:hypothetical protein
MTSACFADLSWCLLPCCAVPCRAALCLPVLQVPVKQLGCIYRQHHWRQHALIGLLLLPLLLLVLPCTAACGLYSAFVVQCVGARDVQFVGAREELVLLLLCLAVSRICVKPHVHMQKEAPCTRLDGRFQVSGVGVPNP